MKTPKKNFIHSSLYYYFYHNSLPHILLTSTLIRCSFLSTQCKTCLLKRAASTLISALVSSGILSFCSRDLLSCIGIVSVSWQPRTFPAADCKWQMVLFYHFNETHESSQKKDALSHHLSPHAMCLHFLFLTAF